MNNLCSFLQNNLSSQFINIHMSCSSSCSRIYLSWSTLGINLNTHHYFPYYMTHFCSNTNIGLVSIAPCKVIALNILCFIISKFSLLISNYRKSCRSFSFLRQQRSDFHYFLLTPLRLKKSANYRYRDSQKSNNYTESNTEKKT